MNAINHANETPGLTKYEETLAKLRWTPKHAELSAKLALSKAQWLGLNKEWAIRRIFEVALGGFFQEHPHIPYHTWQSVTEQIACPDECALVAA
jgi:hypothetical protein